MSEKKWGFPKLVFGCMIVLCVTVAGVYVWSSFGGKVLVTSPATDTASTPASAPLFAPSGPKEIKNSIDMEMVLIPSGTFQIGSDKNFDTDASDDETPCHDVTISTPFYMGKYEVTQEQWSAVMGSNPSEFKGRTRPVEQVSWDDAQAFIKALNAKDGKQYRLPTEAEWEYAARSGTKTTYSFGDEKGLLAQYAWYAGNSGDETHPVGQLSPNAWGLYDMHGNVREWCSDWYNDKYYGSSSSIDPSGHSTGSYRVNRGGNWLAIPRRLRAAVRSYNTPGYANDYLGFRLVLPVQDMKGSQAEQEQQSAAGKVVKQAGAGGGASIGQMAEAREKERKAAEEAKQAAERAAQQQREQAEASKSKYNPGDHVCCKAWTDNAGWCGTVNNVSGDRIQVQIQKVELSGFAFHLNADTCSGNKQLDYNSRGDYIWVPQSCIE